jgi:hypothetical protein
MPLATLRLQMALAGVLPPGEITASRLACKVPEQGYAPDVILMACPVRGARALLHWRQVLYPDVFPRMFACGCLCSHVRVPKYGAIISGRITDA